jgi:hypothetical protein
MMNEGIKPKIEKAKDPEDIYNFFRNTFGGRIFFIESLLALKGEERVKLYKLLGLNPDDEVGKKMMSYKMIDVAKKGSDKIKKFPFTLNFLHKNAISVTAFQCLPEGITLNKDIALEAFLEEFRDFVEVHYPDKKPSKPIEVDVTLTKEEMALYEKCKKSLTHLVEFSPNDGETNDDQGVPVDQNAKPATTAPTTTPVAPQTNLKQ